LRPDVAILNVGVQPPNVYVGKMIIKAVKRIFNSDKICRSYSDLNYGVTFLEHGLLLRKNASKRGTFTRKRQFDFATLRGHLSKRD